METKILAKNINKKLKIVWADFLIVDKKISKTSIIEILRHLAKRGHHVHLIAVRSKKVDHLNSDIPTTLIPLRYFPLISTVLFGFLIFFYLPFCLIPKRPDFIITGPSTPFFGFLWKPILSRIFGFKVILDIRSTPVSARRVRRHFKTLHFNISVLMAKTMFDGMTIITDGMRKEVSEKFKINPELISVRSDAASTELFTYEKNIRYGVELRKRFGLSDKFIVLYHGSLARARGILECVNAMMLVKEKYPDIVLFFLGSGPAARSIKSLLQRNGIQDRVIVHSLVDYEEVPKYIAMSDVGIVPLPDHPFWRNQCPLKLLECLAMKRTVIVTDIPAHREILGDKECAIYIPDCNPKQIAIAMEFAYQNKEKVEKWGETGRTIIDQKYNWDEKAKNLENYLLKVKNRSSRW